jgi:hypothetical protein
VYWDEAPKPEFIGHQVDSWTAPSGFDYEFLIGGGIWAGDGTGEYLGLVSKDKYGSDSIMNEYGAYGSEYQSNSIGNPYGAYGSEYRSSSAYNEYATSPPIAAAYARVEGIAVAEPNYLLNITAGTPVTGDAGGRSRVGTVQGLAPLCG